jgi:hypothetical protein
MVVVGTNAYSVELPRDSPNNWARSADKVP